MAKFLIDINLPYYFALGNTADFIHQRDIDAMQSDKDIWDYATSNKLTIITKDVDFSFRVMLQNPPPKVIHIQFGNLKMKPFYDVMNDLWKSILELNSNHKLINVFIDRIEAIE